MKTLFTLTFLLLIFNPVEAQQWNWGWTSGGGGNGDRVNGVISDDNGFVYYCGTVRGTGMLDTIPFNIGSDELGFVMKKDSLGNVVWTRLLSSLGTNTPYDLTIDPSGNIYVTGTITHDVDFGDGTIDYNDSDKRLFLTKYDPNGNVVFIKTGFGNYYVQGFAIDIDQHNNLYIAGEFQLDNFLDTIYFDSLKVFGGGNYTFPEAMLIKYDTAGNPLWIRHGGGSNDDFADEVACDDVGNVYIGGQFSSSAIFDTITAPGNGPFIKNYFVARYDYDGNIYWVKNGSGAPALVFGLEANANGKILATGYFNTSVYTSSGQVPAIGSNDYFMICLDSSGTEDWHFEGGGVGNDALTSITKDEFGNFMVTGHHSDNWTFLDASGSSGVMDVSFMSKVSQTGNVLWYHESDADYAQCNSYNINTDHYYIGGSYYFAAIFGQDTLQDVGNGDAFLGQGRDTTTCVAAFNNAMIDSVSCYGGNDGIAQIQLSGTIGPYTYQWDDSLNQTSSIASNLIAGLYQVIVTDSFGCTYVDSVEVFEFLPIQGTTSPTLDNGSCDGSILVIPTGGNAPYSILWDTSASSQTDTLASNLCNGYYCATIQDTNGCTFSICDTVFLAVDVPMLTQNSNVLIYPNPSQGMFQIRSEEKIESIIIYNILGSLVRKINIPNKEIIIENLPPGIYSLQINLEQKKIIKKIIIK